MAFYQRLAIVLLTLTACSCAAQKRVRITRGDLQSMSGCWLGTMNYSGTIIRKPIVRNGVTTMIAPVPVKQVTAMHVTNVYATADSSFDSLLVSAGGKLLNNQQVIYRRKTKQGKLIIKTQQKAFDKDYNKTALFKYTYTITDTSYQYKQEMQLPNQLDWMERAVFDYKRTGCN